jgi:hypothetical protein
MGARNRSLFIVLPPSDLNCKWQIVAKRRDTWHGPVTGYWRWSMRPFTVGFSEDAEKALFVKGTASAVP